MLRMCLSEILDVVVASIAASRGVPLSVYAILALRNSRLASSLIWK